MEKIYNKYVPTEQIKQNVWIATYQSQKYVVKEVPNTKEKQNEEYRQHLEIKIKSQQSQFKHMTQCLCFGCELEENEKSAYIVAPYYEYNLTTYVQKRGLLNEEETRSIIRNICTALLYFHEQALVYNDLKPANILIRMENGKPFAVLSDFGTVSKADSKQYKGTPLYSSPQALANPEYIEFDQKTDIWSLGVVVYFALFGSELFNNLDDITRTYNTGIKIPPERMLSLFALEFLEMCFQYDSRERPSSKDLLQTNFLNVEKYPKIPYYAKRLSMKPITIKTTDWAFMSKVCLKTEKYDKVDALPLWEKCCYELHMLNNKV